jgi:hypothetical protein
MDHLERATLAVIGGLLAWQILLPPVTGLSNNGDFGKVCGVFDLGAPGSEFRWAATAYRIGPEYHWWAHFYTSEILLASGAVAANRVLSKTPTFDIRFMGVVHGGLYLLGLALLLPLLRGLPGRRRALLAALLAAIACDAVYLLAFNSFYADAGAHVFFVLGTALFLRVLRSDRPLEFAGFLLCSVLFLGAKAQHAALGAPLAALAGYELARRGRRLRAAVAAAAALAASWFSLATPPHSYKVSGVYSTVFFFLLPSSSDVGLDLAALGLDDSYRRFIGTHGYSPGGGMGDPQFEQRFGKRATYARLGRYYLTHPARAWAVLRAALDEGGRIRPAGGNFDPASGMPPDSESRAWSLWSGWKRRLFHQHGLRYLWCSLGLAAIFLYAARRAGHGALGLGLASMALVELGVSTLADVLDPVRHLLLFSALFDAMAIGAVACLLAPAPASSRRPPRSVPWSGPPPGRTLPAGAGKGSGARSPASDRDRPTPSG